MVVGKYRVGRGFGLAVSALGAVLAVQRAKKAKGT